MEIGVLVFGLVLFLIIAPIVAFVRSSRLVEKTKVLEKENDALRDQLRGITYRLYALEKFFETLRGGPTAPAAATPEPARTPWSAAPAKPAAEVVTPVTQIVAAPPVTPPVPAVAPPSPLPPPPAARPISPSVSVPTLFERASSATTKAAEPRRLADLEERLGASWLNKIGTAAFVIGVALLLNYSMHYLGPRGKITLGYFLSVIFIVAGVIGERTDRYRIPSRAVLGGGWALAFFTTYALHNINAVRLVDSPLLGFGLLFAVAVAMVAHSQRYHSQVTTGFAYLLAFASIAASEIPFAGLVASALLAASLVLTLRARKWYEIEPFAIFATYAVHWAWLSQIYEKMGGRKPFPQFPESVLLVSIYWLIYLVSYFLRDDSSERAVRFLTTSFLLNVLGYLYLLHYQSFHPEWRFRFLLAAGSVYFAVSAYSRSIRRHLGFVLASTLGAALIVAAIPYKYSGGRLEILWLLEIEALLIIGWRLADAHLRRLAWAAAAVLAGYVFYHDLAPRLEKWRPPDARLGWLLLALALAFYLNAQLKRRLTAPGATSSTDDIAFVVSPALATLFLLASAWVALPFMWTALIWAVVAAVLLEISRPLRDHIILWCGHSAAVFALLRLFFLNIVRTNSLHNVSLRLITVSLSAAILYFESRRGLFPAEADAATGDTASKNNLPVESQVTEWLSKFSTPAAAYTASATLLLSVLLWQEAATAAIGLAWGLFGLALLEVAVALRDRPLLIEGRLLLLASFIRIFTADLNSVSRVASVPAPVITVVLLAAIYFYAAYASKDSPRVRTALLWFGTISLAALLRFQLPLEWVAVSWAALAVALYTLGRRLRVAAFSHQCYAFTLLSAARCAFDNFFQTGSWFFTNTRVATVVASSVLLYILFFSSRFAERASVSRTAPPAAPSTPAATPGVTTPRSFRRTRAAWAALAAHPQYLFFFAPTILLTVLLSLEVRRGYLTAAWGLEGLIVFLAVLKMDERAYRWFSLALFFLCVGRIVAVDVWTLDALGRIVSFMGLGVALLAVSFVYARHRELLRRVL